MDHCDFYGTHVHYEEIYRFIFPIYNYAIQVSNDFSIVGLISPPSTSLNSSHSSVIHRSPHICTVISTVHLIPHHLLIEILLRIHSRPMLLNGGIGGIIPGIGGNPIAAIINGSGGKGGNGMPGIIPGMNGGILLNCCCCCCCICCIC